jgi:hypothetical protein
MNSRIVIAAAMRYNDNLLNDETSKVAEHNLDAVKGNVLRTLVLRSLSHGCNQQLNLWANAGGALDCPHAGSSAGRRRVIAEICAVEYSGICDLCAMTGLLAITILPSLMREFSILVNIAEDARACSWDELKAIAKHAVSDSRKLRAKSLAYQLNLRAERDAARQKLRAIMRVAYPRLPQN